MATVEEERQEVHDSSITDITIKQFGQRIRGRCSQFLVKLDDADYTDRLGARQLDAVNGISPASA